MTVAERSLRQRVIALVAAYAMALTNLLATFAAAEAATVVDPALCHSSVGQPAPLSDESGGNTISVRTAALAVWGPHRAELRRRLPRS